MLEARIGILSCHSYLPTFFFTQLHWIPTLSILLILLQAKSTHWHNISIKINSLALDKRALLTCPSSTPTPPPHFYHTYTSTSTSSLPTWRYISGPTANSCTTAHFLWYHDAFLVYHSNELFDLQAGELRRGDRTLTCWPRPSVGML